ncbi:MAG: arginase family protein [Acidobacteriota bacterium]|nr:arginase family protein [Acidobacteriota bacterium]
MTVQEVLRSGIAAGADRVIARLALRGLDRVWVHVDLDVLDLASLPAVDSPGTPGFSYAQLSALLRALLRSGRIAGVDIAIYDPSLDPTRRYARKIVACMADVFRPGGI